MGSFQELRYPFTSFFDFVSGGFWVDRAGWHLTLGAVVFLALAARVLLASGSLFERLAILYFATAVYNNPAYSIGGLRFGEICGVGAAALVIAAALGGQRFSLDGVGVPVVIAGLVILVHAALIAVLYPRLDPDASTQLLRAVVVGRIVVLGIVIVGIEEFFTEESFRLLVRMMVVFGTAAALLYLFQAGIFLTGTLPFGTYWDAGFTGVPSFGSVSIERGHFGKFLVPLFPFFALGVMQRRARVPFALMLAVSLVNFSASSFAFLCGYVGLTLLVLRRHLFRPAPLAALTLAGAAGGAVVSAFAEQYGGILQKIVSLGLRGGEGGGRGWSVLEAYLSKYPLGTSFGGSTLRVVGTLPEINMGAYALVAQLSLLAVPIALAFLWLNFRVLRESTPWVETNTRMLLACGVLMSVLVGAVDVLWFVPTLWAPLVVLDGLRRLAVDRRRPALAHAPGGGVSLA